MKKLVIEKRRFDIFMNKFKAGEFGTQRLGQAFHDYFKLDRLADQNQLNNLYAKDGDHALRSINTIFEFN